jgi:hypothetical protein
MNIGQLGRVSGTRELVIPGTQYLIIYHYDKSSVIILRILFGAQQWPDAQGVQCCMEIPRSSLLSLTLQPRT